MNRPKQIVVFILIYIVNMAMIQWMQIFVDNLYGVGFVALRPAAALSFVLNQYFVFREVYEAH